MAIEYKGQRDLVKFVRDASKSKYDKGTECYICGDDEKLEFHHYNSLSPLLHRWMKLNRKAGEDVLEWRDEFIAEHHKELYVDAVTLCKFHHHERLHGIYGKSPSLGTAAKQERWVNIQKDKQP